MLGDTYNNSTGLEIINNDLPAWLSKEDADDDKLTKFEFEGCYIQQMTLTKMPSPSQKEIELYYQLYSAKHKGEGRFMEWILHARDGEIDGEESDAAFQYVQGKFLDDFHGRALGSEIVEFLPPDLTSNEFHSSYATPVREEEKEKAKDGELVRRTSNAERADMWQLYKARVISRYGGGRFVSKGDKEWYMELMQKARESLSVSVDGAREEGEVRG